MVKTFTSQLEMFANSLHPEDVSKSFRFKCVLEMKVQITEFVRNFHGKQIESMNGALDREKWKVANEEKVKRMWPSVKIKRMLERKSLESKSDCEDSVLALTMNNNNGTPPGDQFPNGSPQPVMNGFEETLLTAEVFYLLLDAIMEYCQLFVVTGTAEVVLGVVELLRVANTRINHLILGAGAVELKVCKSITVTILVIVLRGLHLIAESVAEVQDIFDKHLMSAKSQHVVWLILITDIKIRYAWFSKLTNLIYSTSLNKSVQYIKNIADMRNLLKTKWFQLWRTSLVRN